MKITTRMLRAYAETHIALELFDKEWPGDEPIDLGICLKAEKFGINLDTAARTMLPLAAHLAYAKAIEPAWEAFTKAHWTYRRAVAQEFFNAAQMEEK